MDLFAYKWRPLQVVLPLKNRRFLFSDSIYLFRDVGYQGNTMTTVEAYISLVAYL